MKSTQNSGSQIGLRAYMRPIVKIIISLIIIFIDINRGEIIKFTNRWVSVADAVLGVIIIIISFWCIYDAVGKLGDIYFDRKDAKRDIGKLEVRKYAINDIVAIARREDVIEIEIRFDGKIVKVGSSSECKPGRNDFFNKMYFCNAGKMEDIETIEEFRDKLEAYSTDGVLEVFSIDGIPVVEKKKKCANKRRS